MSVLRWTTQCALIAHVTSQARDQCRIRTSFDIGSAYVHLFCMLFSTRKSHLATPGSARSFLLLLLGWLFEVLVILVPVLR